MKFVHALLAIFGWLLCASSGRAADSLRVSDTPSAGDFVLVAEKRAAPVLTETSLPPAVARASEDLRSDLERVSGLKPALSHDVATAGDSIVLIGVLGQSALLDQLVAARKLEVSGVSGEWESYLIQTVRDPWPGVKQTLVIAGSDPRGAIYGIYSVSEAIGVSPWNWWADVPVQKRASLAIRAGVHRQGPPAVKYRGIFINDEDWGLQPWAAKTFEPETGDIGPKTYGKVFELLLRLRANTCWPGMHPSTRAFNHYSANKHVADAYGIVMGSSHAEPMLRNNVDEWPHDRAADYNYVTNREGVLKYWEERVQENGRFENLYTMGMRGVHDSGMPGGGTLDEKAARLTQIISEQRELLKKWVNPDPAKVPQIFCPYKEVLEIYRRMKTPPPDDITLVWPDDNWGYVRQFSNEQERKRRGGAGVYYHISYWGSPYDYLWLCSTPPALIWEEMTKAYDYGANRVWIVNVGDIKPAEIGMEFFLKLAWDPHGWTPENVQSEFLRQMATRDFGAEPAPEIAAVLSEYYRLNFARKPEHMGLDPKKPLLAKSAFSTTANGNEAQRRLDAFAALATRANALGEKIPAEQRNAYYQLVLYPVRGAALMNEKGINLGRYFDENGKNPSAAAEHLARARAAHDAIQRETRDYNEKISGGKWRLMMSPEPRGLAVFKFPETTDSSATEKPASSTLAPWSTAPVAEKPMPRSAVPNDAADFFERDGRVVMEAEHASARRRGAEAEWLTINGVGYNGAAVSTSPALVSSRTTPEDLRTKAPALEYRVWLEQPGEMNLIVRTLPTWAIVAGQPQRYAAAIDDAAPRLVSLPTYTDENNPQWQRDVLRNAAITGSTHAVTGAGAHTLKIWMVDPGLVIDTLMLERAGAPDAGYVWPAE
jgi:hypothetical protein